MKNRKDLTGLRFHKLTVISFSEMKKSRPFWKCRCDCGSIKDISHAHLLDGLIKSCGCMKTNKLAFGTSAFREVFKRYKYGAKKRGLSFLISEDDFEYLIYQPCFYCGTLPNQKTQLNRGHGYIIHNGIDRIDSSRGYEKDNCVPCCSTCNRAKLKMTFYEYLEWLHKIYLRMAMNFSTKEELENKGSNKPILLPEGLK